MSVWCLVTRRSQELEDASSFVCNCSSICQYHVAILLYTDVSGVGHALALVGCFWQQV